MKNFVIRTISAIFIVAILVGGIWYSWYSPLTKFIVLAIVGLGSLFEILKLLRESGLAVLRGFPLATALLVLGMQLTNILAQHPVFNVEIIIAAAAILFIGRCFAELYRRQEKPVESIAHELFAFIYTITPIFLLNAIADYHLVLMLLFIVWANDVAAYIFGSLLGRHRLIERISPRKSVEGFVAGIIAGAGLATLAACWIEGQWWEWAIIGLFTALAGVAGDLFESMYKRSINIKDSGHAIPGHGGFLDRFDALFFAVPVYYLLITLF